MEPYYKEDLAILYNGDARAMSELPDGSIQCVVTSPPFWGLRKYAGEQDIVWDGDKNCEHQWVGNKVVVGRSDGGRNIGGRGGNYQGAGPHKDITETGFCSLCGAWKGAYGLEPTPEMYVNHTIQILREVKRVLRKDGVVFWNIGDSYFGDHTIRTASKQAFLRKGDEGYEDWLAPQTGGSGTTSRRSAERIYPWKPKDLCLIPFRVAIAAQEDGWWVRSVIIWSKQNPMPESVTDRPTESHEYILMLTKSARYYWDAEVVREPYTGPMNRWGGETLKRDTSKTAEYKEMQNIGYSSAFRVGWPMRPDPSGRNIRSVWEFPTMPYPGAHFAVFPEKLPEICIKAATPEAGCCSKCGAPWMRIISKGEYQKHESERQSKAVRGENADKSKHSPPIETKTIGWRPTCKCDVVTEQMKRAGCDSSGDYQGKDQKDYEGTKAQSPSETKKRILKSIREPKLTTGWQGTCGCDSPRVPSLVLDLFAGAGTTLAVGKRLGRRVAGWELSGEYCKLIKKRVEAVTPPLPGYLTVQ